MDIYEIIFVTVGGTMLLSALIYTIAVPVILIRHLFKIERTGQGPDRQLMRTIQRVGFGIFGVTLAIVLIGGVIAMFAG